jgi:phospholipase/carboxylesterase
MSIEASNQQYGEWVVKVQRPECDPPWPVFLLLHGWTGDENSMWIFTSRLPSNALFLAPRGLFSASPEGFSWEKMRENSWPTIKRLRGAADRLMNELLIPGNFPEADFSQLHVIGFSQGAALAYTLAINYPEAFQSVAGLSGFLPEEYEPLLQDRPLVGLRIFIAHGSQDTLVPVTKAYQAEIALKNAGATVFYCEDEVGHKLSASCFRGLEAFYLGSRC